MKKLLLALAMLVSASALGQTTAVTATVIDPNGKAYANGTYLITFVPYVIGSQSFLNGAAFTQSFSGTLDSSGNLSVTLADNNVVTPANSQWRFYICSVLGAPCFQTQITITGGSQSISSQLQAAAPKLTSNIVVNPQPGTASVKPFPSNQPGLTVVANSAQTAPLAVFTTPQGGLGMAITQNGLIFPDGSFQTTAASGGSGCGTGDLTAGCMVTKLQGNPLTLTGPFSQYQFLGFNGSGAIINQAVPTSGASQQGTIELNTDLGGTAAAPNVVGLDGVALAAAASTVGQTYAYNTAGDSKFDLLFTLLNPTINGASLLPITTIHVCPTNCPYITVDAAVAALTGSTGRVVEIDDDNCLGPTFADTFNSDITSTGNVSPMIVLNRCKFPYATNVQLNPQNDARLMGKGRGFFGSTDLGTELVPGPSFPTQLTAPGQATVTDDSTDAGCTTSAIVGATYFAQVEFGRSSTGPWTAPGTESTGVAITTAHCIKVVETSVPAGATCGVFVTAYPGQTVGAVSAVGGTLSEAFQGTVNPVSGTCTDILTAQTATGDPPNDADETSAMIIMGSTGKAGSAIQFGIQVRDMSIDCYGGASGGQALTAIFDASGQEGTLGDNLDFRNCKGVSTLIVEGNRGIRGSANSGPWDHMTFNDTGNGCGGTCQSIFSILQDHTNSMVRGFQNDTFTPNTGTRQTVEVEVNGPLPVFKGYPGSGVNMTYVCHLHNEGNTGGILYAVEAIGAAVDVCDITPIGGIQNVVHLDATSFNSSIREVIGVGNLQHGVKDDINGYSSPVGVPITCYNVGSVVGAFFSCGEDAGASWATSTSSAGGTNQSSPTLSLCGNYSVSNTQGCSTMQETFGAGNTPSVGLALLPPVTGGNSNLALGFKQIQANAAGQQLAVLAGAGNSSLAGGNASLQAGASAFTARAGGNSVVQSGTGSGALAGQDGFTNINGAGTTTAASTISVGMAVCQTATFLDACLTTDTAFVGIALTATTNVSIHENVTRSGEFSQALFDTTAITKGDFVCTPSVTTGLFHDNGTTPCSTAKGVGSVRGNIVNSGGANAAADIWISTY